MLDPTAWLQLLLGTDKRNPCLCLYTNADETELHFYYELELFQVVPNQRECPAFRLLAGQLYNAGPRVAWLDAVLDVDRKTLRTWGRRCARATRTGWPPCWLAGAAAANSSQNWRAMCAPAGPCSGRKGRAIIAGN
jgi:hypothetical protein